MVSGNSVHEDDHCIMPGGDEDDNEDDDDEFGGGGGGVVDGNVGDDYESGGEGSYSGVDHYEDDQYYLDKERVGGGVENETADEVQCVSLREGGVLTVENATRLVQLHMKIQWKGRKVVTKQEWGVQDVVCWYAMLAVKHTCVLSHTLITILLLLSRTSLALETNSLFCHS